MSSCNLIKLTKSLLLTNNDVRNIIKIAYICNTNTLEIHILDRFFMVTILQHAPDTTNLGPLFLKHRPCTTSFQRLLYWAILSSCCQLSPVCVLPASRSRCQVFFGLHSLSLALRVPNQGLSCNVVVWLSQCVAKPSLSSL